jgi:ABC-type nitrate/sulfonate/bicarbonate transport system permease component
VRWLARNRLSGLLLVIALALLWEASVRLGGIEADSWPALSSVFAVFLDPTRGAELFAEFGGSLARMARGYGLGAVAGVAFGLCMGASRAVHRTLELSFDLLRVVPSPALIPPLVLFLGIDDAMKIAIVALAVFWPVMLNTLHGVQGVEPALLDTARTFKIPRARVLLKLVLPAAAPLVFAGMRISLAIALIVTVVAEMIAGTGGIGFYILTMENAARAPEMYAGVVALSALGYTLNRLFLRIERARLRWYFQGATTQG